MNIFYLDESPVKAAQMQHDKHVVKMILEVGQLLCTAHRMLDGELYIDKTANTGRKVKRWKLDDPLFEETLYKATHVNHPSAVWARESFENYVWLYDHFIALCQEYTHRYGKVHLTQTKLAEILQNVPNKMLEDSYPYDMTKMPQAMPDQYKTEDSVQAYKNYYIAEKKSQSKYTNREVPAWL